MVKVSNAFKANIYAPERTMKAKVSFEILDVDAYEDASISITGEAEISRYKQTINKVREMTHKYATFERDYFALDGSSYIPPEGETLNFLEEQSTSGEGTGGFVSQADSTYSFDATTSVFGSQSVKVDILDATRTNNGIRTNLVYGAKLQTRYIASVYLKGEGIVEVRAQEWLGTSYKRDHRSEQITLTNIWTRYDLLFETTNDFNNIALAVRNPVNNGATQTFWIDGLQMEESRGRETARPWTLGGTGTLVDEESELGWWSDELSGADSLFVESPVLEFNFTEPHNSIGLTVTFDPMAEEYPTNFTIEAFDSTDAIILSETVTNNSSSVYFYEQPIENYQRIKITISDWIKPSRRAKVVEVDFGVVREYSGEKLISLKVLEEMDLVAATVPSNEMQFVLDNSDNAFNILNPNGIYKFLKPNQEMRASIGLRINENNLEYVPMGKYYMTEWTVEEGAMTATFVGRDYFTRLDANEYTNLLQNTTLYDLAVDVLNQANIEDYEIDDALKDITTTGFTEPINTREALQMIAIAGKSIVRQNRFGAIVFELFEELKFETGYVTWTGPDSYAGMTTPQVYVDYSVQAIDFETAFEVPKVTLATAVSHLVFKVHDGTASGFDVKFLNSKYKEGQGYEIDNPLINTEQHAADVAAWMFREYNFIAEYQAYWRQNPALECGNVILIEDAFGGKKKSRIIKQEFNFAGYLDGITDAKGGV